MSELSSTQRKYLRSRAHHLEPVVLVGRQGVTDQLMSAATQALDAHELIKIRFNEFKAEKRELSSMIAERLDAHLVGIIGHVAILYRRHPEGDRRKIELPE